jgi:hypothetical protein
MKRAVARPKKARRSRDIFDFQLPIANCQLPI